MNLLTRFFPAYRFRLVCVYTASLVLILAASTLISPPLYANATSTSSIQVSNFTMTSSGGTIVFLGPWTAEAFAQAQNSFGENNSQFNSSLGGLAQASASVQFASAQGAADAQNMLMMASSGVNIPGGVVVASAIAEETLFNQFEITGAGGPVNVGFGVLLSYMQNLFTDGSGLSADSEVAFTLSVDGQVVLFSDSTHQIGSNGSWTKNFSGELSNTISLNENEPYTIYLYADPDDEGEGTTPEPPTIALVLAGAAVGFGRRLILTKRG
jgi:hypothetical protein